MEAGTRLNLKPEKMDMSSTKYVCGFGVNSRQRKSSAATSRDLQFVQSTEVPAEVVTDTQPRSALHLDILACSCPPPKSMFVFPQ